MIDPPSKEYLVLLERIIISQDGLKEFDRILNKQIFTEGVASNDSVPR